jgi:hypothetical protein
MERAVVAPVADQTSSFWTTGIVRYARLGSPLLDAAARFRRKRLMRAINQQQSPVDKREAVHEHSVRAPWYLVRFDEHHVDANPVARCGGIQPGDLAVRVVVIVGVAQFTVRHPYAKRVDPAGDVWRGRLPAHHRSIELAGQFLSSARPMESNPPISFAMECDLCVLGEAPWHDNYAGACGDLPDATLLACAATAVSRSLVTAGERLSGL